MRRKQHLVVGIALTSALTAASSSVQAAVPTPAPAAQAALALEDAPAAAHVPEVVASAPDPSSAGLRAKASHAPVEVLSARTATSSTYVDGSGSTTLRTWSAPQYANQRGAWVPLDSTLSVGPSVIKAKAVDGAASVIETARSVGTGAASDLFTLPLDGGRTLGVGWLGSLPAPSVVGSTARFTAVTADMDLSLVQQRAGTEFSITYGTRAATPSSVTIPIRTPGLRLLPAADGGLEIRDGAGPVVGYVSPALVYDAQRSDSGTSPTHTASAAETVTTDASGNATSTIVTPTPAFLSDPRTVWPVTVDPTFYSANTRAYIQDTYVYSGTAANLAGLAYMDVGRLNGSSAGRAYIKFTDINTGNIPSDSVIRDANLVMLQAKSGDTGHSACGDSYSAPSPDGLMVPVRISAVTGAWDQSNIKWGQTPATGAALVDNYATYGNGSCAQGVTNQHVTGTVAGWINSGVTNNGFVLSAPSESAVNGYREFLTSESSAPPHLDVTFSQKPYISGWSSSNSIDGGNGLRIVGPNPSLNTTVIDPDTTPSQIVTNYNLADDQSGATIVDTNAGSANSGGENRYVTPTLANDHYYRWIARPYYVDSYGQVIGNYLNPQYLYVDAVLPTTPNVSSNLRVNDWVKPNSPDHAHLTQAYFDASATDVIGKLQGPDDKPVTVGEFAFSLDGQPYTGWQGSRYTWNDIGVGWHVLSVKAHDLVGNESAVQTFGFGVGTGSVGASRTWKNLILLPSATSDKTGVTYNYRRWGSTVAFTQVPAVQTRTVSNSAAGGSPISGWPVARSGSDFPKLAWDAAATLGSEFGGLLEVQACYSSAASTQCSSQPVQLDRSAFGGSYATSAVGPGTLSLATGDLDVTAPDVSVPGLTDSLTFGREHTTLHPVGSVGQELMTANQRGLETGTSSGFIGVNASISSTPATAAEGTRSLTVISNGSSSDNFASVDGDTGGLRAGLQPGHRYTLSYRIWDGSGDGPPLSLGGSTARSLRAVAFWSSGGAYQEQPAAPVSVQNAWQPQTLTFTVPSNATEAFIRLYNGSTTNGQAVYYDAMSLQDTDHLTASQQSLEDNTAAGFTANAASLIPNTNVAFAGSRSLAVLDDGSTQDNYATVGASGGSQLGMQAGHRYVFGYHEYLGGDAPTLAEAGNQGGRGLRAVFFWHDALGFHELQGTAPTALNTWLTESLAFTVPANADSAFVRLYNGSTTAGKTVYYDGLSLRETQADLTNATSVLGDGWKAELPGPGVGAASATIDDQTSVTGELAIVDGNGARSSYTLNGEPGAACKCEYFGVGEASYDGSTLTKETDGTVHLKEADGTETVWKTNGGGYQLDHVSSTSQESTVTYGYDGIGRVTDALAPTAKGVSCALNSGDGASRGLAAGCRDLSFSYALDSTPIPGDTSSTWGAYPGLLNSVTYWASDQPASGTPVAPKPVPVATYRYDSTGHLRSAGDPRITPQPLPTTYSYDGTGRLVTVTPAGLTGMGLTYDGTGRLATLTRANPSNIGGTQTSTLAYDVPTTGNGAPVTIDASTAAAWGQSQVENLPVTATAVFGPDHPPAAAPTSSDYPYAGISYINADGRATNTASYGAGAWQYGYTRYDQATGNAILSLTPRNRLEVVNPNYPGEDTYLKNATTAPSGQTIGDYRSNLAGTVNAYSADGVDLLESLGPVHLMVRGDGTAQVEGRTHTVNTYDEGKPDANTKYHLLTTSVTSGQLVGGSPTDIDARTTVTDYAPIDGKPATDPTSGWTLRKATKVTQKVTGGDLFRATRYDEDGRVLESRMPRDPGSATAASTSVNVYYRADGGNADTACNRADVVGWPCTTGKGSTSTTAGPAGALPALLTNRITRYTRYAAPVVASDGNGTVTRTTTTDYDAAGRSTHTATTASIGTAIADQYLTRDNATGLTTCVSTATGCTGVTTTTGYDTLGRVLTSTDADGSTTTTGFDTAGRVVSSTEAKSSAAYNALTTYTYDGGGGTGSTEHRGLVTAVDSHLGSAPSGWTAVYDENGSLTSQGYPNGTTARFTYDETGYTTNKSYDFPGCAGCWYFNRSPNAFGQATWTGDNTAAPTYSYDTAGRLASTYDQDFTTGASHVFKRRYTFDADSNRAALNVDDTSYPSLLTADSPAGYWRLDETTGTSATDASGNNRTGTYTGGWTTNSTGITPGDTNRSVSFNGTTGTMTVPDNAALRGNGSFTLAFAAKINAEVSAEWPTLLSKGNSGTADGYTVYYDKTTHALHYKRNNQDAYASTTGVITTSGWHSYAISYDATAQTLTFSVDGKTNKTFTGVTFPTNNGTAPLTFAAGDYNANISLDEAAVYTKPLTADRISYLWQAAAYGSYRQAHTYDEADRLTDTGYTYDGLGRIAVIPGNDAGGLGTQAFGTGGNLAATYYANDMVATLTQSGITKSYSLDPLRRTRATLTTGVSTGTLQHYADSASGGDEAASWIETTGGSSNWTRNVLAPDGMLAATQTAAGTPQIDLTDLTGSIVGTENDAPGATPTALIDSTEYGTTRLQPIGSTLSNTGPDNYGWLGGARRDEDALGGLTLMGERVYNPNNGRFLQLDPVAGGSCNDYDYVCQDPINSQDLSGRCVEDGCVVEGAVVTALLASAAAWLIAKAAPAAILTLYTFVAGHLVAVNIPVFSKRRAAPNDAPSPAPNPSPAPAPTATAGAEHTSNARPSTTEGHQNGQARKGRDNGGEKGDRRRKQPPKKFGGGNARYN